MKRKVISLTLAMAMVLGSASMLGVNASAQSAVEAQYNTVLSEVQSVENTASTDYAEYAADLEAQLQKLQSSVENATMAEEGLRFNTETIYDLNSIGARLELFTEIGKTIATASNELNMKVRQAHIEVGAEITKALIIAADPFATTEKITAEIGKLQAAIEKARNMPEVNSNDKATIYVKKALDKAIWNTRFERDKKVLGKTSFEVYDNLNKQITKAVGVQFRLSSTVADVEQAIKDLESALDYAISQAK